MVGWSTSTYGSRAFVYTKVDGLVELPAVKGLSSSFARDINDFGDIVGTASSGTDALGHAVVWIDGATSDIGTLGNGLYSDGWAINNDRQVVGSSATGDFQGSVHAFLYSEKSGMIDLSPDHNQAAALDINEFGQITGYFDVPRGALHAFYSEGEKLIDLGVPAGFSHSTGSAINSSGLITGTATSPGSKMAHIFLTRSGSKPTDVSGKWPIAYALGMNSSGQIVGYSSGSSLTRGFVYSEKSGVQDLNSLISPFLGCVVEAATDINDAGMIVGYGYNTRTRTSHALLLFPKVTPPND